MSNRRSLVTLLSGLGLAAVLLALSAQATRDTAAQAQSTPDQPAAEAPATDQPAPKPSADPPATQSPAGGAAAPAPPPAPPPALDVTWAGRVDGGSATIAITARGNVAVAYLCDGTIESWLRGTAADGRLTLTGRGATLTGTFGNGRARGTVTAAGRRFTFDVAAVPAPSGLYRATATVRGARVVGGWIVLPDGSQVGLATVDGLPVTPSALDVDSGRATVAGTPLTASPVAPATVR